MHQYLEAIGFETSGKDGLPEKLLRQTEHIFSAHHCAADENFCEYQKEFGAGFGISSFGKTDETYHREYYVPFFEGTGETARGEIFAERRLDKEAYIGICEDMRVGISLIFHLQNLIFLKNRRLLSKKEIPCRSVTLSGLCREGTILLPVSKDSGQRQRQQKEATDRTSLMQAARSGDTTAIEHLTKEEWNTYTLMSKRLMKEDVYSIVDTYIMPYGLECDQYSILGEIRNFLEVENESTGVVLYILQVEVNGLIFDVCVPKKHVLGEPQAGRRLKAIIWLQGRINFDS